MFKKFPPEIPGHDPFPFSLNPGNDRKHLRFRYRTFDYRLRISHDIEPLRLHFPDTVHDVLTGFSLEKYDITGLKGAIRLFEIYVISFMDQKRGHTVSGYQKAYLFALLHKVF